MVPCRVWQMVRATLVATTVLMPPEIAGALSLQEKSDAILEACLAAGRQQKIEGKIGIDGSITLTGPALKGKGDIALSREEWSGLIGGISKEMTQLQAEQADKVRECMAPAREVLMKKILESD
jgi:hypothetical protein